MSWISSAVYHFPYFVEVGSELVFHGQQIVGKKRQNA